MRIDFFAPAISSITGSSPKSDGVMKYERTRGPLSAVRALEALALAETLAVAMTVVRVGGDRVHAAASKNAVMLARMAERDVTRPVRKGEEVDTAALARFLAVSEGDIAVEQFPGGHSNLTYLVKIPGRELVLRRPPVGNTVKSAHDMGREVRMLTRLAPHYAKAPRVVASAADFYVMERIRGTILRRKLPDDVTLTPALARSLSEMVVDGLVELHAIDVVKTGLVDLGKPDGFVERQVRGWSERYIAAKTDDIVEMTDLAKWLVEKIPTSLAPTIVHNDWKLDNLVLTDDLTSIVGVLDWEMSTVGDPLIDLGTTLSYWVEAGDDELLKSVAFGPTMAEGTLTRREVVARYAERSGRDVSNALFYVVFALFKTAVVAQQIYARWKRGVTKDERFGAFIYGVRALAAQAARARDTNSY